MSDELFLTVPEVAERLRMNPETIRVWLRDGRLRGVRPGGKRAGWRIPESEVRRILGGHSVASDPS
ncbi:MAG: helix-turn-helix domain-containing protein [Chloroflexi bacterium]|nr:helix-turn-helix domain-containing protein [Chloroflexota bacterium]